MSLSTRISDLATRIATEIKLRGLPTGGAPGQIVTKTGPEDFAAGWSDAPEGGGTSLVEATRGEWAPDVAYAAGDLASVGDKLYLALASSTNLDPSTPSTAGSLAGELDASGSTFGDTAFHQEFTTAAGASRLIGKVALKLSAPLAAGSQVGIASPHAGGGVAGIAWLASTVLSAPSGTGDWVEFELDTPVSLSGATTYAVAVTSSTSSAYMTKFVGVSGIVASAGSIRYGNSLTTATGWAFPFRLFEGGEVPWMEFASLADGLPPVGPDGQVLTVVGGVWASAPAPSGGGGGEGGGDLRAPIQTITLTDVSGAGSFAAPEAFHVIAVSFSGLGRVRMYQTAAGRAADLPRLVTHAYPGGRGRVYEYYAEGAEVDEGEPFQVVRGEGETVLYYQVDGDPMTITLTIKEF